MYTSYIGKKFLTLYKEKENKPDDYSAKEFFDEVLFPIFFDDERHLMHVGNSPFFQKTKDEDNKKYGSKSKAQLANLHKKVESGIPSGSIYVGYGAEEIQATSSGQLTTMSLNIDSEEIYTSWIGQALAIGVNGGYVALIDEPEILFKIYTGWFEYRKYLSQTSSVKDKQIETWNGHWIYLTLNLKDSTEVDLTKIEVTEIAGNIAIPTKKWVNLIFTLSKKFQNKTLTIYAYTLSQTNVTLGFINVYLFEIKRLFELRDKIFINSNENILVDNDIETLETFYNFDTACKIGSIGLKSIEPRGLREFMPKGSTDYSQGKDYKIDEKTIKSFHLYKLWIMAMLNKQELLKAAAEVASILVEMESINSERGKTTQSQSSKDILESKNIKSFIEGLNEIMKQENSELLKSVVREILLMPSDNFPLYITLIKFEYNYQNLNKKK
jgi:hypothetical protein